MSSKKIKKVPKAKRIRILFDKCWEQMSLFTRLKWADSKGFVTCVTCNKRVHVTACHAGHFKHGVLDFIEKNINPQCIRCNRFLHGNLINYYNYLLLTYGKEAVENLLKQAEVKHKYTEEELTDLLPKLEKKVQQAQNGELVI